MDRYTSIDFQGHRGARGLMPENSIPAFQKAVELGVSTLEMDVVITGDGQVLVSHEPYMNGLFCLDPEGKVIPDARQMEYNIYQMSIEEVRRYDCGSKPHPDFPDQINMKVVKPLLSEVFNVIEPITNEIRYNIEIKSEPRWDGEYHPEPAEFSKLVYDVIDGRIDWSRVTIQSFDFRILRYFHVAYPNVPLAVLVENDQSIEENLKSLGFYPAIYSCDYVLLARSDVDSLHELGIRVIPWTVNDKEEMDKLINWGVDGIITDYPNKM
ncbi:glycerophosphodiester phosphodiesterase [Marinoscillum sp. MHG1-6]|uniref:glycerophosphodiester phosphodiesterase n=1 Tax=Marinoscillum sp. MHG1-6 TaxID=2959627 RepID=UPI00215803FE|nr:glycerophosphodiester phosphodiesterase [Marinoscillum sp. MHG1-6]